MKLDNQELLALAKSRPIVVGSVLWIAVLLIAVYFRSDAAADIKSKLEQAEKREELIVKNLKYASQLESQLLQLKAANAYFEKAALKHTDIANNQKFFYQLETESAIKLIDLRQSPPPALAKGASPNFYTPISFSLSIQGEYENIIGFLKRLEVSPSMAKLNHVAINGPQEGIHSVDINLNLLGLR